MTSWLFALTFLCALGSGLVAGIFYGFSTFIMGALGRIPPPSGIAAMQSINVVVINPLFLGVFMGTAIACLALAIAALVNWQHPAAALLLTGALLYFAGTFLVTMLFNVPLNNGLAAVAPDSAEGAALWSRYLNIWTAWNHVRTAAALIAAALLTFALAVEARVPAPG